MERFLSPGFKVKPLEERESTQKVRRGRPAKQVPEGALDLGQQRVRKCGSRQNLEAEHKISSLERQVEALKLCQQAESKEERMNKMLEMLDDVEEQNKGLLEQMPLPALCTYPSPPAPPLGQFNFGAKPAFSYRGGVGCREVIGLCGLPIRILHWKALLIQI